MNNSLGAGRLIAGGKEGHMNNSLGAGRLIAGGKEGHINQPLPIALTDGRRAL
ncbi:hypothetical protein [Aeromonas molluscorum]